MLGNTRDLNMKVLLRTVTGVLILYSAALPMASGFTLPSLRFPATQALRSPRCLISAQPRFAATARLTMMDSPYDSMTVAALREKLIAGGEFPMLPARLWPPSATFQMTPQLVCHNLLECETEMINEIFCTSPQA